MIPKIIHPDGFDFGMPVVAMLDVYSKGFRLEPLRKRAAQFDSDLQTIERKPGHAYLHLITTGAWEKYGSNNNGDAFNRTTRSFTPFLTKDAEAIPLDGGLEKYHDKTFSEFGGVYKNHDNRHKSGKPSGYIVKAAYNKDMDRGELIIGVETDKWEKELEKIANEQPVYFSMAADVPYDWCSGCGHRSRSFNEYCEHLKNDMLAITKEGHQICAINDKPLFHDISGVFRPADKIAFALRKVASDRVVSSAELAQLHGLTPRVDIMRKYAGVRPSGRLELLMKLAAIEKELLAASSDSPMNDLCLPFVDKDGVREFEPDSVRELGNQDHGALFGALRDKLVVMPLETFLKVITGTGFDQVGPLLPSVRKQIPGVFGRMLADPGVDALMADGSYEPDGHCGGRGLMNEVGRLVGSHSLAAGPVHSRVVQIVITGVPKGLQNGMPKAASSCTDAAADFVAREYARYVLSFAEGLSDDKLRLTVAQTVANSI